MIPPYRKLNTWYVDQTLFSERSFVFLGLRRGMSPETYLVWYGQQTTALYCLSIPGEMKQLFVGPKRDFRALGRCLKELNAQVSFSSLPLVLSKNMETNQGILSLNTWLHG